MMGLGLGLPNYRSAAAATHAPQNVVLPAISGSTVVGQTLSTTDGTWLYTPTSYSYQWAANAVDILGATASTYLLTSGELGKVMTVTVTATNARGSTPATSAATSPVTNSVTPFYYYYLGF